MFMLLKHIPINSKTYKKKIIMQWLVIFSRAVNVENI